MTKNTVKKLPTKTVTIRVDEDTKHEAEIILAEIGINLTGLFNACLKAVVREKRIPFVMVSKEFDFHQMVKSKLEESEAAAKDSSSKRYTHNEIFSPLRKKYGYEVQS